MNERDELRSHAYLDGALAPSERTAFEADLARDPALLAELEALRALDSALRAATESERLAGDAIGAKTLRALERERDAPGANTWRLVASLLGALLLGFTVAELLCLRRESAPIAPPIPTAPAARPSITSILGEVLLSRANEKGGTNVLPDAPWQDGDTLSTTDGSTVLAEIPEVIEVALSENTTLTRIDDLHFELALGHVIALRNPSAPPLHITIPGVPTEVTIESGGCELEYVYPRNAKLAGPPLLRIRALAGPEGSARIRVSDRELAAGESIRVGDGFLREDDRAPSDVRWYLELTAARGR